MLVLYKVARTRVFMASFTSVTKGARVLISIYSLVNSRVAVNNTSQGPTNSSLRIRFVKVQFQLAWTRYQLIIVGSSLLRPSFSSQE